MSFVLSNSESEWPEFEWDAAKARRNLRVHGVSFPAATGVFLDPFRLEDADAREDYGEDRYLTVGFASQVLLVVAFTVRGKRIRLISARKANRYEEEEYRNLRIPSGPGESATDGGG
ncbi:MAG: BrnT family toxin [Terracidiphilus sp.]